MERVHRVKNCKVVAHVQPPGSPRRALRRQFLRHGLATAGALAALPDGAVAAPPVPSAASLSEVQARMQAQTAAWNRGDIAGFCAAYAEGTASSSRRAE